MGYKWRPSKKKIQEFKQKMNNIEEFCKEHDIQSSYNNDSYYFEIKGQKYRVSNHTVEASNEHGAYLYHPNGREKDTIYIHASKTRLIEIYNDLVNGYELDGKGYRK